MDFKLDLILFEFFLYIKKNDLQTTTKILKKKFEQWGVKNSKNILLFLFIFRGVAGGGDGNLSIKKLHPKVGNSNCQDKTANPVVISKVNYRYNNGD